MCICVCVCVLYFTSCEHQEPSGSSFQTHALQYGAHVSNGCLCGVAVLPCSELISITKVISKNKLDAKVHMYLETHVILIVIYTLRSLHNALC